jgi:hypothetical protein
VRSGSETKIIRSHESGALKARVDTLEDMWTVQRIFFADLMTPIEPAGGGF